MVEGRDHRSPNAMPDGPDKSVWGETQKKWLKKTLQESDAVFKILVSPTPMVGPDDSYKSDNHTNQKGFRHEGDAFFTWLKENNFLEKNFYIICGDRHWQYHSIHPSGFEEFSCGALIDQNSRIGRSPGDPESTDPEGLIKQTYTQEERSGGFLQVNVQPREEGGVPQIAFEFYDEYGKLLYQLEKTAKAKDGPLP
jgi:alkaline phosphatase/alkaline phosphatase D